MPQVDFRCPSCGHVDWSRDGYRIRLLEDGTVQSQRVDEESDGPGPWRCANCGLDVVVWDILHARLNGAVVGDA